VGRKPGEAIVKGIRHGRFCIRILQLPSDDATAMSEILEQSEARLALAPAIRRPCGAGEIRLI